MTSTMTDEPQDEDDTTFTRPAILRREGRDYNLTDKQKDALVACVRNPDAGMNALAEHANVDHMVVANLLKSLRRGIVGQKFHEGDYDPRLNQGTADFKDETVKRRAIIDFVARHPGAFDELTNSDVADRIHDDLGVSLHGTYAYNVARNQATHLVHKRRDWYERHGHEDEIADEIDTDATETEQMSVREKLEDAGVTTLPDENLDGVLTAEEAEQEGKLRAVNEASKVPSPDDGDTAQGDADGGASDSAASATATGTASTQAASGDDRDAAMPDAPKTTRDVGNARYEGPATGLDLTSGQPSHVLVGPEDDDSGNVTDELERIYEECGPYGQKAVERDMDIDTREDLEYEIKVLRILVAQQGEYIDQLRRALDNMFVNVEAGFTIPTEDDE